MKWVFHALTGIVLLVLVSLVLLVACLILLPAFAHSVGASFWEAFWKARHENLESRSEEYQ